LTQGHYQVSWIHTGTDAGKVSRIWATQHKVA